jgi:hypothetical protein
LAYSCLEQDFTKDARVLISLRDAERRDGCSARSVIFSGHFVQVATVQIGDNHPPLGIESQIGGLDPDVTSVAIERDAQCIDMAG